MEDIGWKKVWTLLKRYLLVNKVKEISFKLIRQYYRDKTFLVSWFKMGIDESCTFCDSQSETVVHLFWHCIHTRKDICRFIVNFIYDDFELCFKDVLFGRFTFEKPYEDVHFLCNLIILLAKYFIHKCKVMLCYEYYFQINIKDYIKSSSSNKKATKTLNVCFFLRFYVICVFKTNQTLVI